MRIAALCILMAGCASPFELCKRTRYPEFDAISCPDEMVGRKCLKEVRKAGARNDDGSEVTAPPRACTLFRAFRKPVVLLGQSPDSLICGFHEAAHALKWGPPEWVEKNWPCLGENRSEAKGPRPRKSVRKEK